MWLKLINRMAGSVHIRCLALTGEHANSLLAELVITVASTHYVCP